MKNCKFCCEEIHRRARVCPVCHRNVTISGSAGSFLVTVLPILTALASLGFAFYEKYERLNVQDTLARTETDLQVAEVQTEVAQQAVVNLGSVLPRDARPMTTFSTDGTPPPDPAAQLADVENQIEAVINADRLDRQRLQQLERQRLELQTGRSLF